MRKELSLWWRALAAAFALTLAAESTGATAALIIATQCAPCCGTDEKPADCESRSCTIACGSFCVAVVAESAVAIPFAASGEHWTAGHQSGTKRPAKPPVPPPRG